MDRLLQAQSQSNPNKKKQGLLSGIRNMRRMTEGDDDDPELEIENIMRDIQLNKLVRIRHFVAHFLW